MYERVALFRRVAADPALRRVEVSFGLFSLAESATWLAMLVYAFDRGGTGEAGLVAVLGLICAVVVAPFAAYAGDRFSPHAALAAGFGVQATTMAFAALAVSLDRPLAAYGSMIAVAAAVTFTRPVIGSLLPSVTQRPADLVAANVVMSMLANVGVCLGPLVAAVLLVVADAGAVFALFAVAMSTAAVLVLRLARADDVRPFEGATMSVERLREKVAGGLIALAHRPTLRLLVLIMSLSGFSIGLVDVLAVVVAEDRFPGRVNVGVLAATVGLGATVGALMSSTFISRPRLARFLLLGAIALSVPMLIVVNSTNVGVLLASLFFIGMGQSVLLVVGSVSLQRWAPPDVLARIFGLHESIQMLAMACGAAAFAVLADQTSLQTSVGIIVGTLLVVAAAATWRLVAVGIDVAPPPSDIVERLLVDPIFRPLDVRAIERLAFGVVVVDRASESVVIAQGDAGDRYYLVLDGALRVMRDGEVVRRVGPGDSFGEVALLRDVPRTATVICTEACVLYAIERAVFVEAVTGHPRSLSTADAVIDSQRPTR